ncbi:MAG: PilW family protein [Pseudomonadota bacterium]
MMNRYSHNAGFTIVELLVAMLIGLFLIAGTAGLFISSKQTYSSVEQISRLQENARFATSMLGDYFQLAGFDNYYRSDRPSGKASPIRVLGCGGELCSSNRDDGPDQLSLEYDVPADQPDAGGWEFVTCGGAVIDSGSATRRVIETFRVAEDEAADTYTLECRSFDAETQNPLTEWVEIVGGIRDFQVMVGLTEERTVGFNQPVTLPVERYVNFDQIAGAVGSQNKLNERVKNIRLGLLVRAGDSVSEAVGEADSAGGAARNNYQVMDGPVIENDSGQLYYIFTETFELGNAV